MNPSRSCLSCDCDLSPDIVKVGDQLPSAIYPKNEQDLIGLKPSSLNLCICTNPECRLVQLGQISELEEVFARYPYESGATATMKNILSDVATEAGKVSKFSSNDTILDIGGNDGTLLSCFENARYRVNIDAAQGIPSVINQPNDFKVVGYFSSKKYFDLNLPPPKLITSVAMFYHLSNPVEFCREVAKIMTNNSLFCMQMTYLGSMYDQDIYDNIVHEHRAYYSLHSLKSVFDQVGLKIHAAKKVQSYGGSIRIYATLAKSKVTWEFDERILSEFSQLKQYEQNNRINSPEALKEFNLRLQSLKEKTRDLIIRLVKKDGPMVGFGASTKGNMICQLLGLTENEVSCIYDNNPRKIGSFLVGSGIPIVDEEAARNNLPRNVLVLPYYYKDFFQKLLKEFASKEHKTFAVYPLPEPKVVPIN